MGAIEKVIALEKEALDGWSSGNALEYGIHAHPEQTYFDNLGAQHTVAGIENIRKYVSNAFAELVEHQYEMVDLKARQYGDTVILTYQYHPTLPDGSPSANWAATVIYARFDNDWKMVHAGWTMLMPPPG